MVPYLHKFDESLDEVHKRATDATERIYRNARVKGASLPQFEIGDFVLYCRMERPGSSQKHDFQWVGPFQVNAIKSEYIVDIRDICNGRILEAHTTRLSFYSDRLMEVDGALVVFGVTRRHDLRS